MKTNLMLMANLHHLGRGEGRRRTAELLERFDLAEAAQIIRELVTTGVTVFLTTQYDQPAGRPIIVLRA